MGKNIWIGIAAVLIVVVITLLIAVHPWGAKHGAITIGIMTPLTGEVASWGDMQKKATAMALDEINNQGGIHGRKVEVVFEDDQATPKVGVNAFTKLADIDRVPIVVGSPASGVTLAVAPIVNEKKVVLLCSGSTATAVGKAGPYVFRIMPSDEIQAEIMTNWAIELGFKKIAIIYVQNAWGDGLRKAFEPAFTARGGSMVAVEGTASEATDFRGTLTKVAAANPDAIYAPLYTRGAGLMVRQAKELGIKQQILGADVYETPEFVEVGGAAAEGVLFTRYGQYDGLEYQAFAKRYRELYHRDPEAYACYCYDTIKIAFQAISACPNGDISGPRIRAALLAIKGYKGVTGVSTFDGKNSASGKTFDRIVVKNGKNVPWSKG